MKTRIFDSIALNAVLVLTLPLVASAQSVTFHDPVSFTVAPGSETPVFAKTLPRAECTLNAEGGDPQKGLKLFSDQDGHVHFNVKPPANESAQQLQVLLKCQANDEVSGHPIILKPSKTPTAEMPFPTIPELNPNAKVRPPLTGDPLALSQDELLKAGYPYRPDPDKAPGAYASWLRAVSKPTKVIEPQTVLRPDIVHSADCSGYGAATYLTFYICSSNWSGVEVLPADPPANMSLFTPYTWVTGTWTIPSVSGEFIYELETLTHSSFWIGLDGDSTCTACENVADLVQDGTDQDVYAYADIFSGERWSILSYEPWIQVLPDQSTNQLLNFVVGAGDEMFSEVWVTPLSPGNVLYVAHFVLHDTTQNTEVSIPPVLIFSPYIGQTAEWVMERPTTNNNTDLSDLADYSTASMWAAYAQLADGQYVISGGGGETFALNRVVTMVGCDAASYDTSTPNCATNDNDVLSTVTPIEQFYCIRGISGESCTTTSDSMTFTWQGFH